MKVFDQYHDLLQEKAGQKADLTEKLFDYIKTLDDVKSQNLLQNLRRDIHNDRRLKKNQLEKAYEIINSVALNNGLQVYQNLLSGIEEKAQSGALIYKEELLKIRKEFRGLIQSDVLKKGLILSSNSLLERIDRYLSGDPNQVRVKEVQTEQSLIKYITTDLY